MAQFFLFVNGRRIVPDCPLATTLASFLRQHLRLTGCKVACGQGMCGACTVLLSQFDARSDQVTHAAVNACLLPLAACHAKAVTTVEGLGSARGRLQPLQVALAAGHGVQCGFCSPGFVMSAYAVVRTAEDRGCTVTAADLEAALRGNFCRCTGYRPILQALKKVCCGGGCSQKGEKEPITPAIDATQELLFPPALRTSDHTPGDIVRFFSDGVEWIEVEDWSGALLALKESPTALVIGGNGMLTLQEQLQWNSTVLLVRNASEFALNKEEKMLEMGCGLTLANLEDRMSKIVDEAKDDDNKLLLNFGTAVLSILRTHTSPQVKNVASIGGSLAAYKRYPYLPTLLSAMNATIRSFHRQTSTLKDVGIVDYINSSQEQQDQLVIKSVSVSLDSGSGASLHFAKLQQHPRFKFCLALLRQSSSDHEFRVAAARHVSEDLDEGYHISVMEADSPEEVLKGLTDSDSNCGASRRYFNAVASFWVNRCITGSSEGDFDSCEQFRGGEQTFDTNLTSESIVGQPLMSPFALEATSGEAEYLDDATPMQNELHVALVSSSVARAKLLRIDASKALTVTGVVDFLTAKDVPCNSFFTFFPAPDEVVFAESEVNFVGQIIGAVLADDPKTALTAAKLVHVEYEPLTPVLTLEEAMEAEKSGSYCFQPEHRAVLSKGNTEHLNEEEESRTVCGAISLEAQEHFYMEPQSALVYPSKEKDRLVIYTSSHSPFLVTNTVSHVLKLPTNRIESRVFRVGGSFGGKETCHLLTCLPAAVAALKHRRPARCIFTRSEDFRTTGCRHPFTGEFKATVASDLSLERMKLSFKAEGGYATGLSAFLPSQLCIKSQSAYHMPNFRCEGKAYRTNTSSNTAMRGFCHPEATFALEMALETAAEKLGICPDELRERNILRPGDHDAFQNEFTEDALLRCWQRCRERAEYDSRQAEIKHFNSENKHVKKGIALIPTLMPIGFDVAFLNQGMAVINVEASDGHISLVHSGIEIGQGIEVKMLQVASQALGLPVDLFHTPRFSSTHLPNASPSSASGTTDRIGNAVLVACDEVKKRLDWKALKGESEQDRVGRWKKTVFGAYFRQINLSFQGFYALPGPGLDPATMTGFPGFHYSFGVACTEVQLDGGTGEYRILRTDIVMDLGRSLNPVIDIGQIEGAFMQGVGLFCYERLDRNQKTGDLPKRIVLDYGVPRSNDIPAVFNVHLLEGSVNAKVSAVYSSKGIGEPPLALGSSAYFAMRRAVAAFASKDKMAPRPIIPCPATPDRVKAAIDVVRRSNDE